MYGPDGYARTPIWAVIWAHGLGIRKAKGEEGNIMIHEPNPTNLLLPPKSSPLIPFLRFSSIPFPTMASSIAMSLRSLAATDAFLPKPSPSSAPFLLLLSPSTPRLRLHLHLRSTRRLPLAPLAASDSFESASSSSAAALDFAEPGAAEESDVPEESYQVERYAPEAEEEAADDDEEEEAVEASAEVAEEVEDVEEVGEYVEPPEEAKAYVRNLPYDIDSERLAQLFEHANVVEVSKVRPSPFSALFHMQN